MRILVATDAWHPQINGVVRTLTSLQTHAQRAGIDVRFLSPEGFRTVPLPTYPGIDLALPVRRRIAERIEEARPDAIHIATEGTIGHAVRAHCLRERLPFTTSFTTKFPEYIAARFGVPAGLSYWVLRRFHGAARVTMASTGSLIAELRGHGFRRLGLWTRGVDTDLFAPARATVLDLPRPIFLNVGRVAVEKNLDAFLALDLPGSKVVIGDGPALPALRARHPGAHFLGAMRGDVLAAHMAAADVFVFPSLTDTYGVVQLEALACGVPVAAFPVTGPRDVLGGSGVGALDEDLRRACLAALDIPRDACRAFALRHSWERSVRQFARHAGHALIRERRPGARLAAP
jgi:glycosyltransferase involved in cell wall biosynthesis